MSESLESPFCKELRSKKYFFLTALPLERRDIVDGSNHCWCALTHQVLGPDDQAADPDDCRSGRACFRPLFDPSGGVGP